MNLTFVRYDVLQEIDFVENEVDKIRVNISVVCNLVGDNNTNEISIPILVINENSQTGDEMDAQRINEINNFINTY